MESKTQLSWAALKSEEGTRRKWYARGSENPEMHVSAEGLTAEGDIVKVQIPVEHFLNSIGIELKDPGVFPVGMAPPGTTLAHCRVAAVESHPKTLNNSDINGARKQVKDIEVVGNGDMFQLLCKASSKAEGWMKSTKAMEIPGVGCVVQVTTQQSGQVAEATTFVPGVVIVQDEGGGRKLISRMEAKRRKLAEELAKEK